jgi:large subunit ribosomal protein L7/L12
MADNNFDEIIQKIESMTVLELSQLVKTMEEKFGVSAAMMAAPAAGGATDGATATEKDTYDVVLKDGGAAKIQVIKIVREVTGLGLKEAKDLVDQAPKTVKEGLKKEDAEAIAKQITDAGGTVELK